MDLLIRSAAEARYDDRLREASNDQLARDVRHARRVTTGRRRWIRQLIPWLRPQALASQG